MQRHLRTAKHGRLALVTAGLASAQHSIARLCVPHLQCKGWQNPSLFPFSGRTTRIGIVSLSQQALVADRSAESIAREILIEHQCPCSLIVPNLMHSFQKGTARNIHHGQDESTAISMVTSSGGKQAKRASSRPTAVNLMYQQLPCYHDCKAHASHGNLNGRTRPNTNPASGIHFLHQRVLAVRHQTES